VNKKKSKLNQVFNGRMYYGYDEACIDDDGYLQCPKCGNASTDYQHADVEILQHAFFHGRTRSTLLIVCIVCDYHYAFQSMIEPSENIVVVER
jgi:predicted nucleic-acid-binding Zn-ribbon protein